MLQYIPFLLPSFCCFLWVAVLLCRWKRTCLQVRTGIFALVFAGISSLIRALSLIEPYEEGRYLFLGILEIVCILNFFSCMILYIKTLTDKTALKWKDALVFLPGLIIGGTLFCLYFYMGGENMAVHVQDLLHPHKLKKINHGAPSVAYYITYIYVYRTTLILMANIALVYAWNRFSRYKTQLKSDLPLFYFLFSAFFFVLLLFGWEYFIGGTGVRVIGVCYILWACALYYFGYYIATANQINQSTKNKVRKQELPEPEEAESTHTEEEIWNKIREKLQPVLEQLMEEEKIFLQRDLHLEDLAARANTNRTYMSRLIKEEYGYGFPEYIARRRIEYACEQARENPDLTLEQLAEQSGFSYGTAFSRAFKQYTGLTFREWKKNA